MLDANVWRRMVGVDQATVIEEIEFDEEADTVVVHVRPRRSTKRRCGRCGRRAPGYDLGEGGGGGGRWIWARRSASSRRDAPRVDCPTHGVTVAAVPWARHGAGHTRDFDDLRGLARGPDVEDRGHGAVARSPGARSGRSSTRVNADIDASRRSPRRASPDRDRRDLLQARPPLPDRGRRSRHAAGWSGQARAATTPTLKCSSTSSARNALRCSPTFPLTWPTGSPGSSPSARPEGRPERRPVPRRRLGDRAPSMRSAARCGAASAAGPGHRHGPARQPDVRSPPATQEPLPRPLRAVEEPREPHRPSAGQARLDRQDPPLPLARLPAQRRAAVRVRGQRQRRQERPRPLAVLGQPLPHPRFIELRTIRRHRPASTPPWTTA